MLEYTTFYGLKLNNVKSGTEDWSELTEHLAMNGYTYDTNGEDTLFVYDEEVSYVETILKDREINFERL